MWSSIFILLWIWIWIFIEQFQKKKRTCFFLHILKNLKANCWELYLDFFPSYFIVRVPERHIHLNFTIVVKYKRVRNKQMIQSLWLSPLMKGHMFNKSKLYEMLHIMSWMHRKNKASKTDSTKKVNNKKSAPFFIC